MAEIELSEETREQAKHIGSADIVVGIAGAVAPEELHKRAEQAVAGLTPNGRSLRVVFAWPGAPGEPARTSGNGNGHSAVTLLPFAAPSALGEFWSGVSACQRAVLAVAGTLNARVCIVLGADLAGLQAQAIQLFAYAISERQCALAMPVYPTRKYDGLLSTGILSPLSRALYGKRLRYPVTFDFAASDAMSARLARSERSSEMPGEKLLWPVTLAATQSPQSLIGQVHVNVHHQVATAGLELSAVLGQLVGSLFEEMENSAAQWQRVRGSQPAPVWGNAPPDEPDGEPIDAQPMLDSFLLGSKSLDEVWRLVLTPNTMLEMRRLTRVAPGPFRMPDELWASIVYDFALAWRLRTISRVHLLGALTPLYLGWAASWVGEVADLTGSGAEQRFEQFARVWEEKKPYLLSRWRWPDRFNP